LVKKSRFTNYFQKSEKKVSSLIKSTLEEYSIGIENKNINLLNLDNKKFYSNNIFLISNNYLYKSVITTKLFSRKKQKILLVYPPQKTNTLSNISKYLKKSIFCSKTKTNSSLMLFSVYLKFVYKQNIIV
jgi:hypothetical protein